MPLRCLIVDDNPRFGDEARGLLEHEGVSVVGVATSGDAAVRLSSALAPDLALVDISLGEESGFDVARRLVDESPAIGFLPKASLSAAAIRGMLSLSRATGPRGR